MGQSEEALAYHWRQAGENEQALTHLLAAADQAGRGWAQEHALALYTQALELVPEGDNRTPPLDQAPAGGHRAGADAHHPGRRRPSEGLGSRDGIVDERKVARCDVTRDLVDLLDEVIAEQPRVLSHHLLGRRRVDAVGLRRSVLRPTRRGCAPRRSPGSGGGRSPSTASRPSEACPCRRCTCVRSDISAWRDRNAPG